MSFWDVVIRFVIPVLVVFHVPFLISIAMIVIERRQCAFIQDRAGPNRVDPGDLVGLLPFCRGLGALINRIVGRRGILRIGGLAQPLADAIKLFAKEEIVPARADKPLFHLAPLFVFVPPLIAMGVVPLSMPIRMEDRGVVDYFSILQVADPGVGILFVLAVISLAPYGVALGGWASNSRYSLLGAIRASAQMISYEVGMGLVLVSLLLMTGTARMSEIVGTMVDGEFTGQAAGFWHWNIFTLPGVIGFGLFIICAFAENNRLPFDLPECEAELVGGYHTEYSSMKFAMFMQGEYLSMILMSSLMVSLFFGGWHFPGIEGLADWPVWGTIVSLAVFTAKVMVIMLLYVQVRWTLPRFRYDQLMRIGWKTVIPLALANLLLAAFLVTMKSESDKKVEVPHGRNAIHADAR